MRTESAKELFARLNENDEAIDVEAKSLLGGGGAHTILETVCAFSNEPGLGGGFLLLGVAENKNGDGELYFIEDIPDLDKAQRDFSTQCASMFNVAVRPDIRVDEIGGRKVLRVFVPELPPAQKPVRFKEEPLPGGAWRRIGSSDQRCTEEDLAEFFGPQDDFDASPVRGAKMADVEPAAIRQYRTLRAKANPNAEELAMDDRDLLLALGCLDPDAPDTLTVAGVLLFGSAALQRRVMPDARVDYIRVPGTKWVETIDDTFASSDMRGPLPMLLFRVVNAIQADLPQGFVLKEGEMQADDPSPKLPARVLREAVVNALIHRSYRSHQFTQVIRYDNRIEIRNAGHSLKPEERFGQPGSNVRNRLLAAAFHDTRLAETKGTGMRRMRNLMKAAHLALPVFESDRTADTFTARLLLHHFLGAEDLAWLEGLPPGEYTDGQKTGLIFAREVGAIDNAVYRQLTGMDTLHASLELRKLRNDRLLAPRGKGAATYYVPGERFPAGIGQGASDMQDNGGTMQDNGGTMQDNGDAMQDNGGAMQDKGEGGGAGRTGGADGPGCPENAAGCRASKRFRCAAFLELPSGLQAELIQMKRRVGGGRLAELICRICRNRNSSRAELVCFLGRNETYVRSLIRKLVKEKRLKYGIPEMPKHPRQTYKATNLEEDP